MEQNVLDFWESHLSSGNLQHPYSPVWHAVWNAIATYPDQARAQGWQWKLPYYLSLSGDIVLAATMYASLIDEALNEGLTSIDALPIWFQSGEVTLSHVTPHFALTVDPLSVPLADAAYLVNLGELGDIDTPGSSCFLILEKDGAFSTSVLHNGFPRFGYSIMDRNPSHCSAVDLTGDGLQEILVDHYSGGHIGYTTIMAFELSTGQPQAVPFAPSHQDRLELFNGWIENSEDNRVSGFSNSLAFATAMRVATIDGTAHGLKFPRHT